MEKKSGIKFMNQQKFSHWENIYGSKSENELSWTQQYPATSIKFITSFPIDKKARIIDVGGGESHLVDCLLDLGYENISVLDISKKALEKCKERLKERSDLVTWINADILEFKADDAYDVWHDRATFHFLTTKEEIQKYLDVLSSGAGRYLVMGTFTKDSPEKCSGLPIRQYTEDSLTRLVSQVFNKIYCIYDEHLTPMKKIQKFLFCSMARKN